MRPASVTDAVYIIEEGSLAAARSRFSVTLTCKPGYDSPGTPTAAACTSAGDYIVTNPCAGATQGASRATISSVFPPSHVMPAHPHQDQNRGVVRT